MPMSFPSPVLSVTAGAVLQLEESNDALQALWTVFTKCKASLQDGHRLENATWRLWYREMSLSPKPYRPPTPDSPCDPPSSTNGLGYLDVQRRSNDGLLKPPHAARPSRQAQTKPTLDTANISPPRSPPTTQSSFTKFIHEILPTTSPLSLPSVTSIATTPPPSKPDIAFPTGAVVPIPSKAPKNNKLPAPSTAFNLVVPPSLKGVTAITTQRNVAEKPVMRQPSTLPTPATEPAYSPLSSIVSVPANTTLTLPPVAFPRVVIVDPTPSATPNPTPPTTPVASVALLSVAYPNMRGEPHRTDAPTEPSVNTTSELGARVASPDVKDITPRSQNTLQDPDTSACSDGASSPRPSPTAPTLSSYFGSTRASTGNTSLSPGSQGSSTMQTALQPAESVTDRTARSTPVPPTKSAQSTLKPSDRRSFLQQSPDADDTAGDASSSYTGGDGSSSNGGDRDDMSSREGWDHKPSTTAARAMPPPPPPIAKAASDLASSCASNESRAPSRAGSRAQNRAGQGKVQARAAGGKAARPALGQRRSNSSSNFGRLAGGLGMTSANPPAQTSSAADLTKAAVPKVKSTSALKTAARHRQPSGLAQTRVTNIKQATAKPSKSTSDVSNLARETKAPVATSSAANGTRASPSRAAQPQQRPADQQVSMSTAGLRKIVIATTSSEYETETGTESGDEDSWASEDDSNAQAQQRPVRPASRNGRNGARAPTNAETQATRRLEDAAREAQRQRDLFARVPKRTYSDIFERNRSHPGLLSQLMQPDPTIFPPGHQYYNPNVSKTSHSTQDLGSWRKTNPLQTSKSAAALPLANRVEVQVGSIVPGKITQPSPSAAAVAGPSNGYRPRGPPPQQEMEDDSGSESGEENKVDLSKSMAHQKLAALVGRQSNASLKSSAKPSAQQQPELKPQPHQQSASPSSSSPLAMHSHHHTSPIPLSHPYNLPAPAMPSTPRTTRRLMLSQEMSESLRRQLLWERQVSKANVPRRTQSISNGIHPHAALQAQATASGQTAPRRPAAMSVWLSPAEQQARDAEIRRRERREIQERNRNWMHDSADFHRAGW